MAIDRKQLVEMLGFGQIGAYGFVPPGTWNYNTQSWTLEDASNADRIAEAKRLYAQAGYSLSSPLRLRLLLNSNTRHKAYGNSHRRDVEGNVGHQH